MGEIDDKFRYFLSREKNMADVYNGTVYSGRQAILPEQLVDVQSIYHVALREKGKIKKFRRARDCAKALCRNGHFVILGVELQDKVNYCMPLRCTEYDTDELRTQVQRISHRYDREECWETAEEKFSGMKRTDRLNPAVSIVLYHGEGKWDAACRLKDILDMEGMDEELKELMLDHKVRIYNLSELDEKHFESGLRELIGLMKRKDDKKAMEAYYKENRERFRQMDDDAFELICAMLNMKPLMEKKEIARKDGKVDMCRAFDELLRDRENLGVQRGEKRGEKRGENRLGRLIELLYRDGRMEEVLSVSKSAAARRQLYQEYGV